MNEKKFQEMVRKPDGVYLVLIEMNIELNRLIAFAKNVDTFGGKKIYSDLVTISEDKK